MKKLLAILLVALFLASCGAETVQEISKTDSSVSAQESLSQADSQPEEGSETESNPEEDTEQPGAETGELLLANPDHMIREASGDLPDTAVLTTAEEKNAFFAAYLPNVTENAYDGEFFIANTLVCVRIDPASTDWAEVTGARLGSDGVLNVEGNKYSPYLVTMDMVPTAVLVSIPRKLDADSQVETDWTSIRVEGYSSAFLEKPADYPYEDVLDTYEEWEAFRKDYLPGWYEDFYGEKLFDTRKVMVLTWMESYDSNHIEFESLHLTENGIEASFVRYRSSSGVTLAVCGYRIFLLEVPGDYPVESGEEISMTITEGGTYPVPEMPVECPEEDTELEITSWQEYSFHSISDVEFKVIQSEIGLRLALHRVLKEEDAELDHGYGDEFFREQGRSLLLLTVPVNSSLSSVTPCGVTFRKDGTLEARILQNRMGVTDDMRYYLYLIELPKGLSVSEQNPVTFQIVEETTPDTPRETVDLLDKWQECDVVLLDSDPPALTVLTSYREKLDFFRRYAKSPVHDKDGNNLPIDIEDYYNEEFFRDHYLVVVYDLESSGSNSIQPAKLLLHPDGSLEVVMLLTEPGDFGWEGTSDVAEYLFFLPVPAYVLGEGDVDITVETVRLKDHIQVIYDLTAEELQAFVAEVGEDTFPWDGDSLKPGEDFIEPPVFYRWEDVVCRFACTPEDFSAYLAEYGIGTQVKKFTFFMTIDQKPSIWLQTDAGNYFIVSSYGEDGMEFVPWTEDKFCNFHLQKECKVYVDGEEAVTEVPAVMHGSFAEVPMLELLRVFGAEITWTSRTEAAVELNGQAYFLDLEQVIFYDAQREFDLLISCHPVGGYATVYAVEGELMISHDSFLYLLWELELDDYVVWLNNEDGTVGYSS